MRRTVEQLLMTAIGRPRLSARCKGCGVLCGGAGDTLCGTCWRLVPLVYKRRYMRHWRAGRLLPAHAALEHCVLTARLKRHRTLARATGLSCD